jgi:hypothetical protein
LREQLGTVEAARLELETGNWSLEKRKKKCEFRDV